MAEAAAALAAHLPAALARYAPYASGVVRLEVPVARGASALQWLAGQEQAYGAHEVRDLAVQQGGVSARCLCPEPGVSLRCCTSKSGF